MAQATQTIPAFTLGDRLKKARETAGFTQEKAYVASGRDLRATQELLGHESPQSTQIYTWVDPGALRGAVEGLPIL